MRTNNTTYDDLIIDYLSGNLSGANMDRFVELYHSDVAFRQRFDELNKVRSASMIPHIEAGKKENFTRLMEQIGSAPETTGQHFRRVGLLRIAAIAAILLVISGVWYFYKNTYAGKIRTSFYQTVVPEGSQTKIILPDSTVVWLNSVSSLKYDRMFGKNGREVTLSGEGYFEVAKDRKNPFCVHTGTVDIRDMGTAFNVKAYENDKDVTVDLIEGAVDVSVEAADNIRTYSMKPNDKFIYNKVTGKTNYRQSDTARAAQWTTGKLCFVDATIEQIARDLERKYNVKIEIGSEKIKKELFSGSLNLHLSLKENLLFLDVDKKFAISQTKDTVKIELKK